MIILYNIMNDYDSIKNIQNILYIIKNKDFMLVFKKVIGFYYKIFNKRRLS